MKKLFSAVSALAVAASLAATAVPLSGSAELAQLTPDTVPTEVGFRLSAIEDTGSAINDLGDTYNIGLDKIAEGPVTVPCAMYIDSDVSGGLTAVQANIGISAKSTDTSQISILNDEGVMQSPLNNYYPELHTFTNSKGQSWSSNARPFYAAYVDEFFGEYITQGTMSTAYFDSQTEFGVELPNFNVAYASGSGDTWLGNTSSEFPFFYFEVTIAQNAPEGNYIIDFNDYYSTELQTSSSCMATSSLVGYEYTSLVDGEGSVNLTPLTITVGEPPTDETTEAPTEAPTDEATEAPTEEATTQPLPDSGYVFYYDQDEYVGEKGGELLLNLYLDSHGGTIGGAEWAVVLKDPDGNPLIHEYGGSSPITLALINGMCAATGTSWETNTLDAYYEDPNNTTHEVLTPRNAPDIQANGIAVGACTTVDADGVLNATVPGHDESFNQYFARFGVQIAEDAPDGIYTLEIVQMSLMQNNGKPETVWVDDADMTLSVAKIRVGEVTEEDTTEAPTEATTESSTPGQSGDRLLGDSNVNGAVNVCDVVYLNRFLSGSLDLTDQGKINAEVTTPVTAAADANLDADDSDAILASCIHLKELTDNGPVDVAY